MNIVEKLIDKSKEAFLMAIEVYNKPSIKYRVEGFSFFICNSWELMLKAYMINKFGESSIYYKDNPNRTITLENCIKKVFTNDKDPLRRNLEKIVELRNTSTHFVTEEYEMIYIPLFQASVFNYIEKMLAFHNVDMTTVVPQNFLTLTVSLNALNIDEIRAKYPKEIAEKMISINEELSPIISENNNHFAIRVDHHYYITKDKNLAATTVRIDNSAETGVKIIKELKDPNDTHKYNCKNCCSEINKRLDKNGIFLKSKNGDKRNFTANDFSLFCKYYDIKNNPKLCYAHKIYAQPQYTYSIQAIDFIVEEIKKDPENIIQNLKAKK
ncbi:MAG: DUF3644 domain-containing protein [Ruminococcus sp.]|uniref:DUF3644 domain-containing protein n=1 Tax=Ruminococcus sp. TaxID=41978 RepID=UPI0025F93158|nr:DUF3644 domain-containing protein [Ruminococcus sp.]MBR5682906.1 DUF3644 domain-containing protein [Ruminococcus sp.]